MLACAVSLSPARHVCTAAEVRSIEFARRAQVSALFLPFSFITGLMSMSVGGIPGARAARTSRRIHSASSRMNLSPSPCRRQSAQRVLQLKGAEG